MRSGFAVLLIVVIVFSSGYIYYTASAVCNIPIEYRLGFVDPRFNLSRDEARNAISSAESLWEASTGVNLFTHNEGARLSVNFIFDERQAEVNIEQDLREKLDQKEGLSDTVRNKYDRLTLEYETLQAQYERETDAYERRLQEYNNEVATWNEKGGAPEDVFEALNEEQIALSHEQRNLNTRARALNELIDEINTLGSEGNSLVTDYNQIVDEYNDRFNEEREFTQGDYQGDTINIYQFTDEEELTIVLAHEFGHALALDHIEGEESIMYHFMGAQDTETGLTEFDIAEFTRVCGDGEVTLWSLFERFYKQLTN